MIITIIIIKVFRFNVLFSAVHLHFSGKAKVMICIW